MPELESLLVEIDSLPTLPKAYHQVSNLLDDPNSTAFEIGEVIQIDPAITLRILKVINSAYYGLTMPVYSISQAITLIGNQRLKHMLLGTVLVGVFEYVDSDDYSIQDFWQHSIRTAIIARHLAMQNARIIDHDALFTAGLLHDIGRLVLVGSIPERQSEIERLVVSQDIDIIEAENQILGFDHTDLGEALLEEWGLPYLLIQCVKNHHDVDYQETFALESSIVYLANRLSHQSLPADEEEADATLIQIANWQQSQNTTEQIRIGWQMAEDQTLNVMESYGMT